MLEVNIQKKLNNFDLDMKFATESGVFALLGASGCGKSVTLKCIAGIEQPDSGRIVLDGRVLYDSAKKINLPPQKRRVGYMFQDYALFPNMTVRENVLAGVSAGQAEDSGTGRKSEISGTAHPADKTESGRAGHPARLTKKERKARLNAEADRIMEQFHIRELADQYPTKLSGGQKQRVAMARIVAQKPDVILLDEPFSALDSYLKWQLEQEMKRILAELGKPTIFVTHNRDEVYHLAETVGSMNQGKIETVSPMRDFFASPGTRSAAILSGCKNVSRVTIKSEEGTGDAAHGGTENVPEENRKDAEQNGLPKDGSSHTVLYASDWDLELSVPDLNVPEDAEYVAIRAHYFKMKPMPGCVNIPVVSSQAQEDPFEWTIYFRTSEEGTEIQWKVAKADMPELHVPDTLYLDPKNIMFLRA